MTKRVIHPERYPLSTRVDIVKDAAWAFDHSIEKLEDVHSWGLILETAGAQLQKITQKEFDEEYGR